MTKDQEIEQLRSTVSRLEGENEELRNTISACTTSGIAACDALYRGNSVGYWHDKAVAYERVVGECCSFFKMDGRTSVVEYIRKATYRLAVLERVREAAEKLPMYEPNHDHRVAGHWDSDGAPCRICAARKEFLESLSAARGKEEGEK